MMKSCQKSTNKIKCGIHFRLSLKYFISIQSLINSKIKIHCQKFESLIEFHFIKKQRTFFLMRVSKKSIFSIIAYSVIKKVIYSQHKYLKNILVISLKVIHYTLQFLRTMGALNNYFFTLIAEKVYTIYLKSNLLINISGTFIWNFKQFF